MVNNTTATMINMEQMDELLIMSKVIHERVLVNKNLIDSVLVTINDEIITRLSLFLGTVLGLNVIVLFTMCISFIYLMTNLRKELITRIDRKFEKMETVKNEKIGN